MHNSLEDECGRDLPMVEWERICFGGVSRKDEKETGLGATLNLGHIFGYVSAFISLLDFLTVELVMWIYLQANSLVRLTYEMFSTLGYNYFVTQST